MDRLLEYIVKRAWREWEETYAVYNLAVARHGRIVSPPKNPFGESSHAVKETSARKARTASTATIASLVECYRTDARSPYSRVRYRTRQNYEAFIRRILEDCGNEKLAELRAQDIQRFYEIWKQRGMTMAHSVITMLRMLLSFGTTALEDSDCQRLSIILNKMRFKTPKSQAEPLTLEQVKAIIGQAHKMGRPSIALAQAIQFDCGFQQRDVIGEWVPHSEPGVSDITDGDRKWIRGIRWSEIDSDLILRHATSRNGRVAVVRLSEKQLVKAELDRMTKLPTGGPVIVSEESFLPYIDDTFRRLWRKIAAAVGIPKHMKNMDTRSSRKRRTSEDEEESEKEGGAEGLVSAARP
jgi:Phage integrase, N-terminal SAM-like domain